MINILSYWNLKKIDFLFLSVTTRFCREWAKTMLSDAVDNPVFLRQVIENYKLRVCKERLHYNLLVLNL